MGDLAGRLAAMPVEQRRYTLRMLPTHLAGAGQSDRLRRVLTSLPFLSAKSEALGPQPLIADHALIEEDPGDLGLVRDALRLSAHVLAADPGQLAGQLAARLVGIDAPGVADLLGASPGRPWLRPRTRSLVLAGAPLLRTLSGHTRDADRIVALPDGTSVVSGSADGTVIVWDVETGEELRRLGDATPSMDPGAGVSAMTLLLDGRLAVGRRSGAIELYDAATGDAVGALPRQADDIGGLAPFPDGRRIATATMRGALRVYDLATGDTLASFETRAGTVSAAAIAAGGRVVYGAGSRLFVWTPDTNEDRPYPMLDRIYVLTLETLPDGGIVVASRDGFVRIIDVDASFPRRTIAVSSDAAVASARRLPDGGIVSATWDGVVDVWDAATGERRASPGSVSGGIRSLAVLPDGRRIVTGGSDGMLRVRDLTAVAARDRESVPREHDQPVYALLMASGGRVVSLAADGRLAVRSIADGGELLTFELYDALTTRSAWWIAPAGDRVVAASSDGEMAVVRLRAEGVIERWQAHALGITALAGLRDGRTLSVAMDGQIRLWDVHRSREPLATIETREWGLRPGRRIRALQPLRDGAHALAILAEGPVHVFDIASGALVSVLPGEAWFDAYVLREDAMLGRGQDTWELRDAMTGRLARTLPAPDDEVMEVIVADDGLHAVTRFANGLIDLWRLDDGARICGFGADAPLSAVAVDAEARSIVAGDRTGRLHFLSREDGSVALMRAVDPPAARAWWRFWRRSK